MGRIKALDPDVIHKIAAGEVIISPVNALKELIENSIDAGATSIDVVVKDGGHKLLQITDNGRGIDEEDLPILCQRFTTSKISGFKDLENVSTLGFRGEALASISHISHLTVKTKTNDSKTAIQASFENGKLISTKRTAGVQGTQISVEDLFYNVPMRLRALQNSTSKSTEYQKIVDVVSKYAIQYPGTFSCKRYQDSQPFVIHDGTAKEKIRKVYGLGTHQELLEVSIPENQELGILKAHGYATGLNYTTKRSTPFVFFINNRLVACEPLSRGIRKVYQSFMPQGSSSSFVFLSLEIASKNVDVNVHPTKREVQFLNETEIIDSICQKLEEMLSQTGESRDFKVQSYISSTMLPSSTGSSNDSMLLSSGRSTSNSGVPVVAGGIKPRYEYNLVRTDPKQQSIISFAQKTKIPAVKRPITTEKGNETDNDNDTNDENIHHIAEDQEEVDYDEKRKDTKAAAAAAAEAEDDAEKEEDIYGEQWRSAAQLLSDSEQQKVRNTSDFGSNLNATDLNEQRQELVKAPKKQLRVADLESIQSLLQDVKLRLSPKLLQLFSEHTFVGVVDSKRGLAAVQHDVRLYLVEYHDVAKELFYQIGLTHFANFGTLRLGKGLALSQLLQLVSMEDLSIESIVEMAPMLEEYFQIELIEKSDGWYIAQLPVMLPGYNPPLSRLPQFIADLASKVDWEHERECLQGVLESLATLHTPTSKTTDGEVATLFEAMKVSFVPSRSQISCVVEIANLPGLYRVFERC